MAQAGRIRRGRYPLFWSVESDDTVVQFRLDGGRYVEHSGTPLTDLLAGDIPRVG
jgi:hypothetical protein